MRTDDSELSYDGPPTPDATPQRRVLSAAVVFVALAAVVMAIVLFTVVRHSHKTSSDVSHLKDQPSPSAGPVGPPGPPGSVVTVVVPATSRSAPSSSAHGGGTSPTTTTASTSTSTTPPTTTTTRCTAALNGRCIVH